MSEKTYYQRNKETILNYENNKERLRDQAGNK